MSRNGSPTAGTTVTSVRPRMLLPGSIPGARNAWRVAPPGPVRWNRRVPRRGCRSTRTPATAGSDSGFCANCSGEMAMNSLGDGGTGRRGGIHWWIILLFIGYAAWSWFGNQKIDPYTGAKAHYGASTEEEAQLGVEAFQQVLSQEHPLDPSD